MIAVLLSTFGILVILTLVAVYSAFAFARKTDDLVARTGE